MPREAVAALKYIRSLNQEFLELVNTYGFTIGNITTQLAD